MFFFALLALFSLACQDDNESPLPNQPEDELPPIESPNEQDSSVYILPVVVHVLHNGETIGNGTNLSEDRILRQMEILNEDFRRKRVHAVSINTRIAKMQKLNLCLPAKKSQKQERVESSSASWRQISGKFCRHLADG